MRSPTRLVPGPLLLVGTLALLASGCAARRPPTISQGAAPGWDAVMQLPISSQIRLQTADAVTAGRLLHVDATVLSLSHRDGVIRIERAAIQRVTRRQRQSARQSRIGFGVGAGLGLMVGGITTESSQVPWMFTLAAGWGGLGALIGAISGAGDVREVVVYDIHGSLAR